MSKLVRISDTTYLKLTELAKWTDTLDAVISQLLEGKTIVQGVGVECQPTNK